MQSGFWRRKKNSIRIIFQSFIRSKYPDQLIDLVVIRFYIFIADRPVITQSINTFSFEIFWTEPKEILPQ